MFWSLFQSLFKLVSRFADPTDITYTHLSSYECDRDMYVYVYRRPREAIRIRAILQNHMYIGAGSGIRKKTGRAQAHK